MRGENVPLSLEMKKKLKPCPQNRVLVPLWGSFFMGVPLGIHEDWCISWGCTPRKVVRRCLASFLKPSRYFRPKFRINYSRPFHEFDAILLWGTWGGVGGGGNSKNVWENCTVHSKLRVIDFLTVLFVSRPINPAEGCFGQF